MSAAPPIGFGPDRATEQPRVPERSSPAAANPVTSQPWGSGQGSQTGTSAPRSTPSRPSGDGLSPVRNGCTSPCCSQWYALDQMLGSRRADSHRGQVTTGLISHRVIPKIWSVNYLLPDIRTAYRVSDGQGQESAAPCSDSGPATR